MEGVRVSFMANEIRALVDKHDAARARFAGIRDRAASLADADLTTAQLRFDWIVLNEILSEPERTLAWFDAVKSDERYAFVLDRCAFRLVKVLEERGRFGDIGRLYRDPVATLVKQHRARLPPPDITADPGHRSPGWSPCVEVYTRQGVPQGWLTGRRSSRTPRRSAQRRLMPRRPGLRPRLLAAVVRSNATLAFTAERQVVSRTEQWNRWCLTGCRTSARVRRWSSRYLARNDSRIWAGLLRTWVWPELAVGRVFVAESSIGMDSQWHDTLEDVFMSFGGRDIVRKWKDAAGAASRVAADGACAPPLNASS